MVAESVAPVKRIGIKRAIAGAVERNHDDHDFTPVQCRDESDVLAASRGSAGGAATSVHRTHV